MRVHHDELADTLATASHTKRYRMEVEAMPVRCDDGLLFDADADSIQRMGDIADGLGSNESVSWRLADNAEIPLTADQLRAYAAEIKRAKAKRLPSIFKQYRALRESPATTMRDLEDWKGSYLE